MHRSIFHDDPTMDELLAAFTQAPSRKWYELRKYMMEGNPEQIRRIAHQLKGAGKSYGYAPVTDYAGTIEEKLKIAPNLGAVLPELDALLAYMEKIEGYESVQ